MPYMLRDGETAVGKEQFGIILDWLHELWLENNAMRDPSTDLSPDPGPWNPRTQSPESGRRIVALLNDGSGAQLFWVHEDGLMSNDGEEAQALGKDFAQWAYLPDGFRTWIEDNLD